MAAAACSHANHTRASCKHIAAVNTSRFTLTPFFLRRWYAPYTLFTSAPLCSRHPDSHSTSVIPSFLSPRPQHRLSSFCHFFTLIHAGPQAEFTTIAILSNLLHQPLASSPADCCLAHCSLRAARSKLALHATFLLPALKLRTTDTRLPIRAHCDLATSIALYALGKCA